jgi:long-subunit fatty acid transport protein
LYSVTTVNVAKADAKVESVLPMAINLGVEHKLNEDWNLLAEYVYTQYSKVDKVPVSGTITVGSTPKSCPVPSV